MGSCATIKEMLTSYIEEELSEQDEKVVRDHLTNCKSCSHVFQQAKYIKIRLSGMEMLVVSEEFDRNLQARIATPYSDENPIFTVKNVSWSLSGLAALVSAYFIFLLFIPPENTKLAIPLKNAPEVTTTTNTDNNIQNKTIETGKAEVEESELELPLKGDTATSIIKKSNTENINLIEDKN